MMLGLGYICINVGLNLQGQTTQISVQDLLLISHYLNPSSTGNRGKVFQTILSN